MNLQHVDRTGTKRRGARRRAEMTIVLAGGLAAIAGPAISSADDLPCAWVEYNLPGAGADREDPCSPANRPPGWTAEETVSDREPLIGPYFIEVGITVPLPEGR